MGVESFDAPQAPKQESELKNEQKQLWNERSELMRKMRELPGDSHNLNLQLEENAARIREVETKLKSE